MLAVPAVLCKNHGFFLGEKMEWKQYTMRLFWKNLGIVEISIKKPWGKGCLDLEKNRWDRYCVKNRGCHIKKKLQNRLWRLSSVCLLSGFHCEKKIRL